MPPEFKSCGPLIDPLILLRQQNNGVEMTPEQGKQMDRVSFPPSILNMNGTVGKTRGPFAFPAQESFPRHCFAAAAVGACKAHSG
jgi:hypothetical protein